MKLSITRFLIHHARHFMMAALLLFIGVACMAMSGCAVPPWLAESNQIIGMVGASITSIGAFIAGLTGNVALASALTVISAWIQNIETGISDLETLIGQYNKSADPTILSDIEEALSTVQADLATDFSNLGLPANILNIISGFAGLVLSQLQAWGSLIPAAKATAMEKIELKVPYTKAEFKAAFNKLLEPTGDAEVDAALAKVKKL